MRGLEADAERGRVVHCLWGWKQYIHYITNTLTIYTIKTISILQETAR